MTETKTALITGITGQDGSYLTQLLLAKGYSIIGSTRRQPLQPFVSDRWSAGYPGRFQWVGSDPARLEHTLARFQPDECYNFAAYTSGAGRYDDPVAVGDLNGLAVVRLLEAIRKSSPSTRFLQASSSEVFGSSRTSPQDETTPRNPTSPYGAAKAYADSIVSIYRERYGLFACSAILYNHESPLRDVGFVSRKVTRGAAAISLGLEQHLLLGNLEARRDWGYAGDYVRAMWQMLQAQTASDFVIATGTNNSVRQMCDYAFSRVGLDYRTHVREDPSAFRPHEAVPLLGNAGKATRELGWAPQVAFKELIEMMVDHDVAQLRGSNDQPGTADE